MGAEPNPYLSPPDVKVDAEVGVGESTENALWGIGFWLGIAFAVGGCVAVFLPNLPPLSFLLIALVCFVMVSFGSRRYRKRAIAAVMLVLVLGGGAVFQIRQIQVQAVRERALRAQMIAAEAAQKARMAAEEAAAQASDGATTRP